MRILAVSDLHSPFHHPDAIDFIRDLYKEVKPDDVVLLGDEIDAHGWSTHDRDPDLPGQRDELTKSKRTLRQLYKLLQPKQSHKRVRVCNSNHGQRHLRKALRAGLPSAFVRALRDVLEAPPHWAWADQWVVDRTLFVHGEGFSGQNSALSAATRFRCNTVIGHVHSWAGVQYHSNGINTVWGMNVGCMVDPDSGAMAYAKKGPNRQVLGTGLVLDGVPRFVPMRV